MDRFRYEEVKWAFPVMGFDVPDPDSPSDSLRPRPPHAHNELLQLGTDFGIPGLILALAIYGSIGQIGYQAWRQNTHRTRIITAAAMIGMVSHMIYGIGDAIPLWDRFAFMFWVMIGIVASGYVNSGVPKH